MGGMFDKKTDKEKRKQELSQKEQKARRKSRIITTTVVVVFLLAVVAAIVLNSAFIRRALPAVSVGGIDFNAAQFEYFYNEELQRIMTDMQNAGLGYILPDTSLSLSDQMYDAMSGRTWADLIIEATFYRLTEMVAVYNEATAAGFTLSEERIAEFDDLMASVERDAEYYGYHSAESYLKRIYGQGMNINTMREVFELTYLVDEYTRHYRDSLTYTGEQIRDYYAENASELDIFTYRALVIEAEDPEMETDDPEAALAASMAISREKANAYAADIETEDDFAYAALNYDVRYLDPDDTMVLTQGANTNDMNSIDFYFSGWLLESGREYGDVTVVDTPQGAAVLFFISRDDNSYRTTGMRQLLIRRGSVSPSDYTDGADDPEYIAAQEAAEAETRARAELVDTLFSEAGRTEQALIDLIAEYSDEYSEAYADRVADVGIYENITKFGYNGSKFSTMAVVPEIEEWLFDSSRQLGDSQLVETANFGFHLLYFIGYGEVFADMIADDRMRMADTNEWLDSLDGAEPVKRAAFILVTT